MTMNSAITASVHVLGSTSGYSTLCASADISPGDRQALEVLGFGQTDDPGYLRALQSMPAGFGRPLPSGKHAITRCFAGPPDSAGRQTLLFGTLVFSARDWRDTVCHACWDIIEDSANWGFIHKANTESLSIRVRNISETSMDRDEAIQAVQAWITAVQSGAVAVLSDDARSRARLCMLASLLPPDDRAAFRWGFGVLSQSSQIDIATFPAIADTSGRRRVIPAARTATAPSGYCAALAQFWTRGQPPPRRFIDTVSSVRGFTVVPHVETNRIATAAPRAPLSRLWLPVSVAVLVCVLLVGAAAFVVLGRSTPSPVPPAAQGVSPPLPIEAATPTAQIASSISRDSIEQSKAPAVDIAPHTEVTPTTSVAPTRPPADRMTIRDPVVAPSSIDLVIAQIVDDIVRAFDAIFVSSAEADEPDVSMRRTNLAAQFEKFVDSAQNPDAARGAFRMWDAIYSPTATLPPVHDLPTPLQQSESSSPIDAQMAPSDEGAAISSESDECGALKGLVQDAMKEKGKGHSPTQDLVPVETLQTWKDQIDAIRMEAKRDLALIASVEKCAAPITSELKWQQEQWVKRLDADLPELAKRKSKHRSNPDPGYLDDLKRTYQRAQALQRLNKLPAADKLLARLQSMHDDESKRAGESKP